MSSQRVKTATRAGYKITHVASLAHAPIPAPGHIPVCRTVVIALEAAFTCVFWAMVSRSKDYGFSAICPWPRDKFEWCGLCTHNPLMEPNVGQDIDFTPEELEEMASATKEKNRLYGLEYARNLRANPTEAYRAGQNRNNEKQRPATKARQQAAIANKTYHCDICNVSCRDAASLRVHVETPRHKRRALHGDGPYECLYCNVSFRFPSDLKVHEKGKLHLVRARAASRSA